MRVERRSLTHDEHSCKRSSTDVSLQAWRVHGFPGCRENLQTREQLIMYNRKLVSVASILDEHTVLTGIYVTKPDSQVFELHTKQSVHVLRKDQWTIVYTWRRVNPFKYLHSNEKIVI